jgi:hypothetical protein
MAMKKASTNSSDWMRNPKVHEGGHADFLKVTDCDQKLRKETAKLQRRIGRFCRPRGMIGDLILFRRKRQLIRRLRERFELPYAMFSTQHRAR